MARMVRKTNAAAERAVGYLSGTRRRNSDPKIGRNDNVWNVEGILKKIHLNRLNTNGWIIEYDGGSYDCVNLSLAITLPKGTKKNGYLIPKGNPRYRVSLDKESKDYRIVGLVGEGVSEDILTEGKTAIGNGDSAIVFDGENTSIVQSNTKIDITRQGIDLSGQDIIINGVNYKDANKAIEDQFKELHKKVDELGNK